MRNLYAYLALVGLFLSYTGTWMFWAIGEDAQWSVIIDHMGNELRAWPFRIAVFVAAAAIVISLVSKRYRVAYYLSAVLFGLMLAFPLLIAWYQPQRLEAGYRQHRQYWDQQPYWNRYTPMNRNFVPRSWIDINNDSLRGRLEVGIYLVHWRWGLGFFSAGLLFVICLTLLPHAGWAAVRSFFLGLICAGSIPLMMLYRPQLAQETLNKALVYFDATDYALSIETFNKALQLDPYFKARLDIRLVQGEAYYATGDIDHPLAQLHYGQELWSDQLRGKAIEVWKPLLKEEGLEVAMSKLLLERWYEDANYWMKRGDYGRAQSIFNEAFEALNLSGDYAVYEAIAAYKNKDYLRAEELANRALLGITHPLMRANLYSLLGECYYRRGDHLAAREYFERSFSMDNTGNLWAFKALYGGIQ